MRNKLIIEYDGKRYFAKPELVSVHDGMAAIAVKGSIPIYLPITPIDTTVSRDYETVADIIEEIRKYYNGPQDESMWGIECAKMKNFANRFERAYMREKEGNI